MNNNDGLNPSPHHPDNNLGNSQFQLERGANNIKRSISYGSDSLDSPESDHEIKKRNRLSFVCQTCRKSKTKCDREKPECTRCIKLGLKCVYDVAKQVPPRIPSKDATISRLQRDVDYWKNKAMRLMDEQGIDSSEAYNDLLKHEGPNSSNHPSSEAEQRQLSVGTREGTDYSVKLHKLQDVQINLYKNHSTMIFSKVMKQDVKPLSENYVIIQDKYVSSLIASVFIHPTQNSMIPALTANANISRAQPSVRSNIVKLKEILMSKYKDPFQRSKINEFTDRILQSANSSRNLKIGMILSMLYNTVGHEYLEDHCLKSGEYSDLLQNFITEIEKILPPKDIVDKYKAHFYEYVHPNLPFLDIDMFEETISETVTKDPNNPSKVKLNLGKTHLRYKLENLSILLVIIKLSYISYSFSEVENKTFPSQFLDNKIIESYPISNDVILLAQRCLASENWCACTNENIITCLLYVWSFFAFSPEEGDFFLEHPTDVISSLIMMLSTSIGLHRDPYDYPQLRDPTLSDKRILNQRRLLWISVVGVCSFESTLKGRHPILSMDLVSSFMDIRSPSFSASYLQRVKNDLDYDFLRKSTNNDKRMMDTKIRRILAIHEFTLKRAQFSILLSDLDNLTLSYNNSFSLECIELSRDKIENFIEEHLPLIDFREIEAEENEMSEESNEDSDDNITAEEKKRRYVEKLNFYSFRNSNALQTRLMNKMMMLRTTEAIFLHFESMLKINKEKYFAYYYEYLVKACQDSLGLIKMFNDFFTDKYQNYLLSSSYYNVRKILQLALPSTIFSMLGIILRINLTCNKLYAKCEEMTRNQSIYNVDIFREYNRKLEIISIFQKDLESAIEYIYVFSSENLRFRYFSVFKMFALFDVIVKRMRKGELWLGILKLANTDNLHSKIVKTLRMTLGVELSKKQQLIVELEERNHIEDISLDNLMSLCKIVKDIFSTIPKPPSSCGNTSDNIVTVKAETHENQNTPGYMPHAPHGMGNAPLPRMMNQNPPGPNGYRDMPALNNLQKLSSAASISNSLNVGTSGPNVEGPLPYPGNPNTDPKRDANNPANGQQPINAATQNPSLASQFAEGTTGNVGSNYEFPGFLGGLDLFDYDFLFGSDMS
ncbi:oleate-activated transcription factor [Maudiozyma humilis]|uniref:Oleate-activated transcription factor n=1 Tax=Maudiozyma humilis TaxID=51915 RepID=A0AAV5RRG7_MAUHU|nr:oleate-activated transcription factor [Kazachstania humilis]